MEIYLLRHPKVVTTPGVCIGQTDVPCLPFEISEKLVEFLQDKNIQNIYCSDLQRCRVLSSLLQQALGIGAVTTKSLREISFGDWENRSWDEIRANDPCCENWFADSENLSPPNGESGQDFRKRILSFISDLPQAQGNVLLITHAGWIRTLVAYTRNVPWMESFQIEIDYLSLSAVEWSQKGSRVLWLNEKL